MKYFVNRQCYWGEEDPNVVEIAAGGCDYANADMLSDGPEFRRLGSGEEYIDPREALEAAIAIRDEWNKSGEDCRIEHGFTGGYTMPFGEYPTDDELREWAQKTWDAIEKCPMCGDPLPDKRNRWTLTEWPDDEYCSEYCADKAYYDYAASEEEDLDD